MQRASDGTCSRTADPPHTTPGRRTAGTGAAAPGVRRSPRNSRSSSTRGTGARTTSNRRRRPWRPGHPHTAGALDGVGTNVRVDATTEREPTPPTGVADTGSARRARDNNLPGTDAPPRGRLGPAPGRDPPPQPQRRDTRINTIGRGTLRSGAKPVTTSQSSAATAGTRPAPTSPWSPFRGASTSDALGRITGLAGKTAIDATNVLPRRHGDFPSYAHQVQSFTRPSPRASTRTLRRATTRSDLSACARATGTSATRAPDRSPRSARPAACSPAPDPIKPTPSVQSANAASRSCRARACSSALITARTASSPPSWFAMLVDAIDCNVELDGGVVSRADGAAGTGAPRAVRLVGAGAASAAAGPCERVEAPASAYLRPC